MGNRTLHLPELAVKPTEIGLLVIVDQYANPQKNKDRAAHWSIEFLFGEVQNHNASITI